MLNGNFSILVPRAHVSVGQRQDTKLWNNQFPDSKILGFGLKHGVQR